MSDLENSSFNQFKYIFNVVNSYSLDGFKELEEDYKKEILDLIKKIVDGEKVFNPSNPSNQSFKIENASNFEKFEYLQFIAKSGWTLESFANMAETDQNDAIDHIVNILTGKEMLSNSSPVRKTWISV